jgi:hypothetical protein
MDGVHGAPIGKFDQFWAADASMAGVEQIPMLGRE